MTPTPHILCAENPLIDQNMMQVGVNDLGNYHGQLYVVDQQGRKRLIEYDHDGTRKFVADFDNAFRQGDEQKLTFQLMARLFFPGDPDYEPLLDLQQGEVALFEECNFKGNMWVLGRGDRLNWDANGYFSYYKGSDFKLNNNIASIRLGPLTTATLYTEEFYKGSQQQIIGDQTCLDGTTIGSNTASSIKIGDSAIDILISSNSCIGCKLPGVNLSNRVLRNADLRKADLRGATLFKAKLRKAKFNDALLSGSDTNLNYAELRQADLTGADLSRASLVGADLRQTVLADAVLTDATLTGAHLYQIGDSHLDLTLATLDGADFSGALMAQVKFSGSIKNAKFDRAVLVNAEFDNSVLDEATFNGAWLAGVNFTGASSVKRCAADQCLCQHSGRGGGISRRCSAVIITIKPFWVCWRPTPVCIV
ncbi:MAG: pentapeptide repeat-containing protein [Gammaproteobacteria bacterium]